MTSHLTYLMVQAQEADLAARARRGPLLPVARPVPRRPGPWRARTARMFLALAMRPHSPRAAPGR